MKKPYSIRLEPELLEQLKQAASKDGRSVNNAIELAIRDYVRRINKG